MYEQVLRVPYHYVVFNRYVSRLQVFVWQAGRYQEMTLEQTPLEQPRVWMPELKAGVGDVGGGVSGD